MAKTLKEGAKAPAFSLPADGGGAVTSKSLLGRKVVLYFYPKDDTSGCTKQAIGFSERLEEFRDAGAEVVGVSKDSVASHEKFIKKHGLAIRLGSDPEGKTIEAYGSWVEKSMYGRKYMGIDRSTFLIDQAGVLRRIWRGVKVPGHVDEVLEATKAL